MQSVIVSDFVRHAVEPESMSFSCSVSRFGEFFYRVSGGAYALAVDRADAFLAPCLLHAMKQGQAVEFDVPVSESLARNAADLAFVFAAQLGLAAPKVLFHRVVDDLTDIADGSICGFSGGVDSWFTLQQEFFGCDRSSLRVHHLLFNNVGANTSSHKDVEAYERAQAVARMYGLPLWRVDSNMDALLGMGFQLTHTARNVSTAHLFPAVARRFLYSSADDYTHTRIGRSEDMCYSDPVILPLMSVPSMRLQSSGARFTRGHKTRSILSIPDTRHLLDVCVRHDRQWKTTNCGHCFKCVRTLAILEAAGVLQEFGEAFDLDAYRARWKVNLRKLRSSPKPADREVMEVLLEAGLATDNPAVRLHSRFIEARAGSRRRLRGLRRRLLEHIGLS